MEPSNFEQSNKILLKPEGWRDEDCMSLHVWTDGKHCVSLWRPTWRDRLRILFKGEIWLWIVSGGTQPPVAVTAENPWDEENSGEGT